MTHSISLIRALSRSPPLCRTASLTICRVLRARWARLPPLPPAELKNEIGGRTFGLVKGLPQIQDRLRSEKGKLKEELSHSLKGKDMGPTFTTLPVEGWDAQTVVASIDRFVEGEKVGTRPPLPHLSPPRPR